MIFSHILLFSGSLLITVVLLKLFGQKFALDHPDFRKQHDGVISQIGGIIFGPLLLFIAWWSGLVPHWYIIGGAVSILLGAIDDNHHIPWQIKFIIQFFSLEETPVLIPPPPLPQDPGSQNRIELLEFVE